jgi:fatty acid desaturase
LQDDVPDFRLCCRTFTLNPVVQFLYWHMNYHIEHHMYAAVPCYRLGRLHRLIKHDLPPCPAGLLATWREIAAIQAIQEIDPEYQHVAPVPQAVVAA